MTNIKNINGVNILPFIGGTDFTQIAGDEKNAMFYNYTMNNLLIVTTEDKAETEKDIIEQLTEDLKNGEIDEDDVCFDENGKIVIDLGEYNDTIEDVIGYLTSERYETLAEAVECNRDVVALITKVEGTTSDYNINYDFNPQEFLNKTVREAEKIVYDKTPEFLEDSEAQIRCRAFKTVQVVNGKAYGYETEELYVSLEARSEEKELAE